MSAAVKRKLTPAEYLVIERKAEFKSDFLNGEIFAMAGASYQHNLIKDNLIGALRAVFRGSRCRTLSSDMRVKVSAMGLYTYLDIIILCDREEFEDDHFDTLLNPQVIIEVLSESTESYDRGAKFRHYQQIASLREYVLLTQDEAVCERFVRQADGTWVLSTMTGLNSELVLATVPARVPLADVYVGVEFPTATGGKP
jgi:Uma2 family endonuclease